MIVSLLYTVCSVSVPGYTRVKFFTQGTSEDMDRDNIESLCSFLAKISGIGYHEVAWQGLREGTDGRVEMMALLPSKCLAALQARLDQGDKALENVGIEGVQILPSKDMQPWRKCKILNKETTSFQMQQEWKQNQTQP